MKVEFEKIKELIKFGNLDLAFRKLQEIISKKNYDSLLLLERQYNKYKSDSIRGVLKDSNGLNEISSNILNLINSEIAKSTFSMQDNNSKTYNITVTGDHANISQIGEFGHNATVSNNTFIKKNNEFPSDFDFDKLYSELLELKTQLLQNAESPEHYQAIAEISKAEVSAKEKNSSGVIENLKKAGSWVFDFATKVGTSVVSEIVKGYIK